MTSSHHGLYAQGDTRATMAGTEGSLSQAAVNTFPGLVHTARHTTRVGGTQSRRLNLQRRDASKVRRVRGVKS